MSQKHQRNRQKKGSTVSLIRTALDKTPGDRDQDKEFAEDTARAFLLADIPLFKLNNPGFKDYLAKYTKRRVPDESTIRKNYTGIVYEATMTAIRDRVGENNVYFIVDETMDSASRYVLNVMVGVLDGKSPKSMLLTTTFLEATNNSTVSQGIMNACIVLWGSSVHYERVRLIVSDQAKYMLLAIKNLKVTGLFPNLSHVSCLAHALQRVCCEIRQNNDEVDQFVGALKETLSKSAQRQQMYKSVTGLCLPPKPVLSRWGSWLNTVSYYAENLEKVELYVRELKGKAVSIAKVKRIVGSSTFKYSLLALYEYDFLPKAIVKLEEEGLRVEDQLEIVNEVKRKLSGKAKEKLTASLAKNPDLASFTAITNTFEHRRITKYAPLVSVDVERSFSTHKRILSDKRLNLTEENLRILNIVNYNAFLF